MVGDKEPKDRIDVGINVAATVGLRELVNVGTAVGTLVVIDVGIAVGDRKSVV